MMNSEDRCVVCGTGFKPAPRKLTCSPACAKIRARQIRANAREGERDAEGFLIAACEICGKKFRANRGRKTCSDSCETTRSRARWRKHWRSLPDDAKAAASVRARERRKQSPEKLREQDRQRWRVRKSSPEKAEAIRTKAREDYVRRRLAAGLPIREPKPPSPSKDASPRRCKTCGKVCPPGRRNYCSRACAKLYRPVADGESIITGLEAAALENLPSSGKYSTSCDECGAAFRTNHLTRRICGDECRLARAARKKRRGRATHPCKCEVCGRDFAGDRRTATTCSTECRAEKKRRQANAAASDPAYRERQKWLARKRLGVSVTCVICGRDMTEFENLRKNRYTCSENCRREAARQRGKRSYESRRSKGRESVTNSDGGDQGPAIGGAGPNR